MGLILDSSVAIAGERRGLPVEDLLANVPIYQIDAEQQTFGVRIAFQDLSTGVSALELGYSVATQNLRHFRMIPGLHVLQI